MEKRLLWVLGVFLCAVASRAQTHDVSRDFSLAGNPHGAWSYGWKSAFSADFVLLGTAKTNIAENGIPMEVWAINPYSVPAVLHNATSSTGTSDGGQAMLPPEVIWYYPGPEGTPHHFGIIRFTVPNGGEGTYRIHTSVAPVYNLTQGDTDFHVLQNGVAIYGINLAGQATGQYASELALASGDTVEFAIGRGADNSYHYSGLKIEATLDLISTNPVPPSIVSQPQSQTVTEGSTVTLTVVANGSAPLSYQWSHNGAVIDGAVTASLLLNSVQSGQAGEYSVTVSNAYGGATSEVAVLTVNPAPPQADYDLSRDFSPAGNPNGAWSYGWKSALSGEYVLLGTSKINIADNGVPMEVWAINSYSVPAVLHNATSSTGTSDGGQAILPPGVTWYYPGPEGTPHHFGIIRFTVPNGGEGTYRIHTSVAPVYNLTQGDTDFHVLQNGVAIYGINLAGQATGQYASELALASGDTVEFAIGRGADNSYHYSGLKIEATLDLSSTNPVPPGIVTQPQSQTADLGATVTLGIGVTGSLPLTYRWQFDGADIPGGTNSTLVLEFVQTSQAGDYQVFVSNAYGSATSEVATVTVHSTEVAPTINSQPVGGQVMAGSTFTLRVGALGTAPLSYQWFYNGSSIPGGTFSSLVLSNVQSGHSGTYFVTVTNAFGSATSRGAVVNVIESTQGGAVLFRNGPGNLIYDVDGTTPLPAGSQYLAQLYGGPDAGSLQPVGAAAGFLAPGRFFSGTRIITSVPGLGVATVQVRVWESAYGTTYEQALAAGGKTGASSIFTVTTGGGSPPLPPPDLAGLQSFSLMPGAGATPPTITSHPASQTVLLGQSASFAVAASGSALLYQWWFNGADVVGATGASLSITNAGNADAGDYVVVVRNNGGAVTSEVARLTVETERLLATEDLGPAAEGEAVAVPIHLISRGDVGGMIFVLRYNPDYLSAPEVSWGSVLEGALKESNETALGELRFVFAFGSATVPAGTQSLAVVNLRARSVIENVASQLGLQIIDVSDAAGNPVIHGSAAESGSVGILSTSSLEGDNNGNGRLDIGDATLVLRLLALLDTTRPWDVAQNDLNNNGILDSGDAIKIIRAAAGIGAPPAPPAGFAARSKGLAAAFSSIAGSATLFPGTLQGNPGSLVTVQVRLQGVTSPIAGASFTVNYPANVLRFRGAHDHRAGIIVPRNSSPAWNVSPGENNYSTQDGQLRFAVSSSTSWAANNGVIAELTFKVQNPPAAEFSWPIALSNVEITPDGYELDALASAGAAFTTLPVLGGMSRSPGGSFTFNFEAGGIGSFEVQVSTNLRDWVTLTNVVNASGSVLISDRNAAQFPQRFYRTRIE